MAGHFLFFLFSFFFFFQFSVPEIKIMKNMGLHSMGALILRNWIMKSHILHNKIKAGIDYGT